MSAVTFKNLDASCVPIDGYKPRWGKTARMVLASSPLRETGPGVIDDYVSRAGVMGSYRVYLLDRETGELVARTISTSDGHYAFSNLKVVQDGYLLTAIDNDPKVDALNAAVADLVTPEIP